MAYDSIEPGEPFRSDVRAASISCTIANVQRKRHKPYRIRDFLLSFTPGEGRPRNVRDLKTKALAWLAAMKAAKEDGKKKENGAK